MEKKNRGINGVERRAYELRGRRRAAVLIHNLLVARAFHRTASQARPWYGGTRSPGIWPRTAWRT